MNIPNFLTLIRLFLIPVFTMVFFSGNTNSIINSVIIFAIAGITDVVDGYIARKYNLITKIGTVLDPLADKLMLLTVLTCLVVKAFIPLWVLIVVAVKEFLMIFAGILLYSQDEVVPSNGFGKISTFLFYMSIFSLAFQLPAAIYLMYIAVTSTLIAFIFYLRNYLVNRKVSHI
jgi:cardiolipin synthase